MELHGLGNKSKSVQYRLSRESICVTAHRIGSREWPTVIVTTRQEGAFRQANALDAGVLPSDRSIPP